MRKLDLSEWASVDELVDPWMAAILVKMRSESPELTDIEAVRREKYQLNLLDTWALEYNRHERRLLAPQQWHEWKYGYGDAFWSHVGESLFGSLSSEPQRLITAHPYTFDRVRLFPDSIRQFGKVSVFSRIDDSLRTLHIACSVDVQDDTPSFVRCCHARSGQRMESSESKGVQPVDAKFRLSPGRQFRTRHRFLAAVC